MELMTAESTQFIINALCQAQYKVMPFRVLEFIAEGTYTIDIENKND